MSTQVSQASTSTMVDFPTREPVVRDVEPMPKGYCFVRKGNTYVTRNCRRQTQEALFTVYAVVDEDKRHIGIRVPASIHQVVLESEKATRVDRQANVKKRDKSIEERFRGSILDTYPCIPPEDLSTISRHATANGAGRVGRTGKLETTTKAILAVRAHIRHTKTDYEALLKSGTSRESARDKTAQKITDVEHEWGRVPAKTQPAKKSAVRSKARSRARSRTKSRPRRVAAMKRDQRAQRRSHKK
ncbi:hypothetical protein NPX13_g6849 [Xylaria arbuscula]|uniref:DUF2293 domain-containing protein n=1 Tax=Xylaria arbuscula TaxID=114810 RepID=A0A9W8NBF9_9PEZI|nr:hypothetical protein NPX13_g6849 [Xylaria arbuscula]